MPLRRILETMRGKRSMSTPPEQPVRVVFFCGGGISSWLARGLFDETIRLMGSKKYFLTRNESLAPVLGGWWGPSYPRPGHPFDREDQYLVCPVEYPAEKERAEFSRLLEKKYGRGLEPHQKLVSLKVLGYSAIRKLAIKIARENRIPFKTPPERFPIPPHIQEKLRKTRDAR